MDVSSLSLILAILFGWWLVTVALATELSESEGITLTTTMRKGSTSSRSSQQSLCQKANAWTLP